MEWAGGSRCPRQRGVRENLDPERKVGGGVGKRELSPGDKSRPGMERRSRAVGVGEMSSGRTSNVEPERLERIQNHGLLLSREVTP